MKFLASAKSKVLAGVAAVSALSSNALAAGMTMAADGTVSGTPDRAIYGYCWRYYRRSCCRFRGEKGLFSFKINTFSL